MITISLCMIVKNEETVLSRCLDSMKDIVDEIIIVDTGSSDKTKEIASKYTDKIYDFEWVNDFSKARNFSFSKATMDYIYCADADELLDSANQKKLLTLKSVLDPQIEIVQMKYITTSQFNTVMNNSIEDRPKLYKRLREFTWIDPIHETVRTLPVVFDSDIEILHMPESLHSKRDFSIFLKAYEKDGYLSDKLHSMYAKELYISGDDSDVIASTCFFDATLDNIDASLEHIQEALCIMAKASRIKGDSIPFTKYANRCMYHFPCSEIFFELGKYYYDIGDFVEAAHWYIEATESESVLSIHTSGDHALQGIADSYAKLNDMQYSTYYSNLAKKWQTEHPEYC